MPCTLLPPCDNLVSSYEFPRRTHILYLPRIRMYRRALALTSRSPVDEISHPTFTFYDRRVERSSLPRQHVVLYLLFPPALYARVEQAEGSRRKARSIYTRRFSIFRLSIIHCGQPSLVLLLCASCTDRGCSRRTDCLLHPFRFSFFPSFFARRGPCNTRTYSPRKPSARRFFFPPNYDHRFACDRRKFIRNNFTVVTSRRFCKTLPPRARDDVAVNWSAGGRIKRTIDRPFSRLSHWLSRKCV